MKGKILAILILFSLFLVPSVLAVEKASYDVNAIGGTIEWFHGVKEKPSTAGYCEGKAICTLKTSMDSCLKTKGCLWFDPTYPTFTSSTKKPSQFSVSVSNNGGNGKFYAYGTVEYKEWSNGKWKTYQKDATIKIYIEKITNCFSFSSSRVYCNGTGEIYVTAGNLRINEIVGTVRFDAYDSDGDRIADKVNIAGGTSDGSDNLFRITGMQITKFNDGKIVNNFIEIIYPDGNEIRYSSKTGEVQNYFIIKNIGTSYNDYAKVFVCAVDNPATLKFQIFGDNVYEWQGTQSYMSVSNTFSMPKCPNYFYIGLFAPSMQVQLPFQGIVEGFIPPYAGIKLKFKVVPTGHP